MNFYDKLVTIFLILAFTLVQLEDLRWKRELRKFKQQKEGEDFLKKLES
jgi:hypothetical protein